MVWSHVRIQLNHKVKHKWFQSVKKLLWTISEIYTIKETAPLENDYTVLLKKLIKEYYTDTTLNQEAHFNILLELIHKFQPHWNISTKGHESSWDPIVNAYNIEEHTHSQTRFILTPQLEKLKSINRGIYWLLYVHIMNNLKGLLINMIMLKINGIIYHQICY